MELQDIVSRFALALGIGLLAGIERGWHQRDEIAGSRTAGVRTFSITGILGGGCGALAQVLGGGVAGAIMLASGLFAYAGALTIFARMESGAKKNFSATTTIAGLTTFILSAYAMLGDLRIAAAAAVTMTALLAMRELLHGWVEEIAWPELRSMLVLLAMTFVILPLIPDEPVVAGIDINLRQIWLIAIVLAAVSFVGYLAVKYFGTRHGVLLSSAAGGLVSSTAVTLTNARRAAASGAPRILAAGVALATAISFVRVLAITAVLGPSLLWIAGPPLVAATGLAAAVAAAFAYRSDAGKKSAALAFHNPFQFWPVVGFAAFLGAIVLCSELVSNWFGAAGTLIGAAAVGLADVDAVTVSLARLAQGALPAPQAAYGVLAAVATNTLSKLVIGAGLGGAAFARQVALLAVVCAAGAAAVLWGTLALGFGH